MKKNFIKLFILLYALLFSLSLYQYTVSAAVCFPFQGCTGTSTTPIAGSLLVGSTSTQYGVLPVGSNGKVLTASSTAPLGVAWETSSGGSGSGSITTSTAVTAGYFPRWGTTSALTGTSTIFQSSLNTGIGTTNPSSTLHVIGGGIFTGNVTSSNLTLTSLSTGIAHISSSGVFSSSAVGLGTADVTGTLAQTNGGTGLNTLNQGDIIYGSASNTFSALAKNTSATRYLSNTGSSNNPAWAQVDVSNGITGIVPVANGGTATSTAPSDSQVLSANSSVPRWKTISAGSNITITTSTTAITIASTASGGSTATSAIPFVIEYPTNTEDDAFITFPRNATATSLTAVNKTQGDTVTFNIFCNTNRNNATTSAKSLFTSYQTVTATTTPASLTINGSTTLVTGDVCRIVTSGTASSTQFMFTLGYL